MGEHSPYPFVRPNPLQEIYDAISGGQELPIGGGGYAPPSMGAGMSSAAAPTDSMQALIARMTAAQPVQQAIRPEEPSKKMRALAAIADALQAYGSLRAGVAPQPMATANLYGSRRQQAEEREKERYGRAKAAADADRQSALMEYQRLQQQKEIERQAGEKSATELRALQDTAIGMEIDPGTMTAPQLRQAIAKRGDTLNLEKAGKELLVKLAEHGLEVTEEAAAPILRGDPEAMLHAYRALGKTVQARSEEKFEREKELAGIRKPASKADTTVAKSKALLQKKAEKVMQGTAEGARTIGKSLESGSMTPDDIKEIFQAELEANLPLPDDPDEAELVKQFRQMVINHWAKHVYRPIVEKYDKPAPASARARRR